MNPTRFSSRPLATLLVLATAVGFVWLIAGDVFKISADEGIYLEGGRRIAQGQQPYRDFFVLTGPLTFWIQGALASLSGARLAIMRLPMILDVALLAGSVCWIVSRLTDSVYGAASALVFLLYESRLPKLVVNHRWDSAALATVALVAGMEAERTGRRWWWILAGLLIAASAWATPPLVLVGIPLLMYAWRAGRRNGVLFLAGGTAITAGFALYMLACGTLTPMVQSMIWTGANYSIANRLPYGLVVSLAGSGADLHRVSFSESPLTTLLLALPAILPIAVLLGWAVYWRYGKDPGSRAGGMLLLGANVAFVLCAWPRWTSDELLYTSAIPVALCALLCYRMVPAHNRRLTSFFLIAVALVGMGMRAYGAMDVYPFASRVGELRGTGEDKELLDSLGSYVAPGDTMFAFPYLAPVSYFLEARNPTRYSFLQPGMMNEEDENRALADLKAAPPHWVIYEEVPAAAYLALWPNSDPARIPMTKIRNFIQEHYRTVQVVGSRWGTYQVRERTGGDR